MPNKTTDYPPSMAQWHIDHLQGLFPETIQTGFWKSKSANPLAKIKGTLKISEPTYDPNSPSQSIDLFSQAAQHRDSFLELYRELKRGNHSAARDRELRELTRDAAVASMQLLHDTASIQINKFFDRSVSFEERLLAYRRWSRTIDHVQDMYAKLPSVLGDNFVSKTKDAEDLQVRIRSDVIAELVDCDPALDIARQRMDGQPHSLSVLGATLKDAQMRITTEVLLHSIKTINPSRDPNAFENQRISPFELMVDAGGGTIDIGQLQKYPANNRTYNCARVVPATLGVMFGAKIKAVAALDDKQEDRAIRSQWKKAYESVYGRQFTKTKDLNELFDAIASCPAGTTGIIFNAWEGTNGAHVSVVSNVDGVVCMVEGQTSEVMVRNPHTRQFESHRLGPSGVVVEPYDASMLKDIEFMSVPPALELTEYDRAKKVMEELHKPFFESKNEITDRKGQPHPKKYFVDAPEVKTEQTTKLKGSPNRVSPPPGPIPSRQPIVPPAPPMIGPPPVSR